MQAVAIRPPLVYGPGVRANFLSMLSWVHKGVPLPLGAVANSRSMVSIWNLCDLIRRAIELPAQLPGVLMVSDGGDLSTPEIIRGLAAGMGRSARLVSVPPALLKIAGALTGRSTEIARLLGSLQVDIAGTRSALNWTPPVPVEAGLARTAQWYLRYLQNRNARAL
jgi:UDP-glucose 4-epimerase